MDFRICLKDWSYFFNNLLAGFENSRQMADWEHLLGLLGTSDVRTKISNGEEIIAALSPPNTFQKGDDMGQFIDGLTPWINNSNFKVCSICFLRLVAKC